MAKVVKKAAKYEKFIIVEDGEVYGEGKTEEAALKDLRGNDFMYDMEPGAEWEYPLYQQVGVVTVKRQDISLTVKKTK